MVTKKYAIEVIDTIINSIEQNPAQFHIMVNVTGQKISSSGGIGAIISASGGAPGSTTIGQSISVGGAQLEFARKAADEGMKQQMQTLINGLNDIRAELKRRPPNRSKIQGILDSFKQSWVPTLIVSLVANVLAGSIGL